MKDKQGYSWIPAATNYWSFGGLGIYVRYRRSKSRVITLKQRTARFCHVLCPDRELIFTWDANKEPTFYPAGQGFDEFVSYNMLDDHVINKMGFDYVMVNYAHTEQSKGSALNRTKGTPTNSNATIISDSGGFQFATGVASTINPVHLVKWYNDNTDAGMILDVPLVIFDDPKLVERAARVQAMNNELMLRNKSDTTELINILHGTTNDNLEMYRDIVERPDIQRIALAGAYRRTLLSCSEYMCNIMLHGPRYKQYHLLGVFGAPQVALMAAMANLGDNPPHVTSDSTTHIQSSKNHAYHYHYDIFKTHKRLLFGLRGSLPNVHNTLPCNCPVCSVVKYQDIFGYLPGQMIMNLVAIHNATILHKYGNILQDAVRTLPYSKYVDLVMQQMKHINSDDISDLRIALDYINITVNESQTKANKKYKSFLNKHVNGFTEDKFKVGLFGSKDELTTKLSHSKRYQRMVSVIDTLEKQAYELLGTSRPKGNRKKILVE